MTTDMLSTVLASYRVSKGIRVCASATQRDLFYENPTSIITSTNLLTICLQFCSAFNRDNPSKKGQMSCVQTWRVLSLIWSPLSRLESLSDLFLICTSKTRRWRCNNCRSSARCSCCVPRPRCPTSASSDSAASRWHHDKQDHASECASLACT